MRWVERVAVTLGVVILFALSLVVGVALHLGVPPARRTLIASLNDLLDDVLVGSIVIHQIDSLSLWGATGIRAEALDAQGRRTILAENLSASWSPWTVMHGLLFYDTISVDGVHIGYADVSLEQDREGVRLATTFRPRPSASPPGEPGAPLFLELNDIHVAHAWGHGVIEGVLVDAEADDVAARLVVDVIRGRVALEVTDASVHTRSAPYDADLSVAVQGDLRYERTLSASAQLSGQVGPAPVAIAASYDQAGVTLELDAGPVSPAELARRFGWAPRAPMSVSLLAGGPCHAVTTTARLLVHGDGEPSRIDVHGEVDLTQPSLRAQLEVSHADLGMLAEGAPRSDVDAGGDVELSLVDGAPRGRANVALLEGNTIGGYRLPPAQVRLRLAGDRLSADASIDVSGAAIAVSADMAPVDGGIAIDGAIMAQLSLHGLPFLSGISGRGAIEAQGTLVAAGAATTLDARARGLFHGVRAGAFSAARVTVDASVTGDVLAPDVAATVHLFGLSTPAGGFERAVVRARGVPQQFKVAATVGGGRDEIVALEATAAVAIDRAVRVSNVKMRSDTTFGPLVAEIDHVLIDDQLQIHGLVIDGPAGHLHGSLSLGTHRQQVSVLGRDIDLGRLGRRADLAGTASVEVDLARDASGVTGRVTGSIRDGRFRSVAHIAGRLSASFDRRSAVLDAALRSGDDGVVEVNANVASAGPWWSADALRRLTGEARVLLGADLPAAQALADELGIVLPFALEGDTAMLVTLHRDRPDRPPDIALALYAERLGLQPHATQFLSRLKGAESTPFQISGLGFEAHADIAASGDTDVELRLVDRPGAIALADANVDLPYAALWRNDLHQLRNTPALEWLEHVPVRMWSQIVRP